MSSDGTALESPRVTRPRVIKSGQVAGAHFHFPALELAPPLQDGPCDQDRPPEWDGAVAAGVDAAEAVFRRASALLEEAELTAASRLQEAEAAAGELLAKANVAADALQAEARQCGHAEGRSQGYEAGLLVGQAAAAALLDEAKAQAASLLGEAQQMKEEAQVERARRLEATEQQMLDLAFLMARQVLRTELALRPEAVLPMVEAALAKLKGEEEPQVRVGPETCLLLEQHRGRLLAAIPGARRLLVEADPAMAEGDFALQGAQGFVDGRIDRQVERLAEQVGQGEQ